MKSFLNGLACRAGVVSLTFFALDPILACSRVVPGPARKSCPTKRQIVCSSIL